MRSVLFVLIVAGCAAQPQQRYRWVHASGDGDFEAAFGQCEAQALSSHPAIPQQRGVAIFGACMRGKGWHLVRE